MKKIRRPLTSQLIHRDTQKQRHEPLSVRDELQARYENFAHKKLESRELRKHVMLGIILGEITEGEALSMLRSQFLKLTQSEFSKLVGVGRKTISDIENNRGNFSMNTLRKVYKPVGLTVGVQPVELDFLLEILNE